MRAVHGANQLVEFELDGVAIAILGILNQKNHQECDNHRTRVDDQLPCITELEYRACDPSDHDDEAYYEMNIWRGLFAAPDLQYIRFHAEF